MHIDAHLGKCRCRVAFVEARANAPHALHQLPEVHGNPAGHPPSELLRVPHLPIEACGSDDGLGRDAASVEAVAPQKAAFDERDPGALANGSLCRDETRRPRSDNQQVVGRRHESQPPSKPARFNPVRMGAAFRINFQISPER